MTQLSDVLTVNPPNIILANLLNSFPANLSANGWQPQRITRALTETQADTSSTTEGIIAALAAGGFIDTAIGPWLDLIAWGFFRLLRTAARQTILQLRLTDSVNQGPYNLTTPIGVAYPSSASPLYYRAQAGSVTVPRGGFVDAPFVADKVGAVYNVAPGQIVQLSTPAPGVVVTSPAIGSTGSILIQAGLDQETDAALQQACINLWGLLAQGYTVPKIKALLQQLDATLTRFAVLDPGGLPGIVDAYCATASGPATYAQALAGYNYLLDPSRKPCGNYPVRVYPSTQFLQALAITLYVDGTNPNAQVDAATRLSGYQGVLDLGRQLHASRLVDVLIDEGDKGVIGAVLTNLVGVELLSPAPTDAVVFSPTWTVV